MRSVTETNKRKKKLNIEYLNFEGELGLFKKMKLKSKTLIYVYYSLIV